MKLPAESIELLFEGSRIQLEPARKAEEYEIVCRRVGLQFAAVGAKLSVPLVLAATPPANSVLRWFGYDCHAFFLG